MSTDCEDFYKIADQEKDYRQMIISTPPSNINKESKFGIIVNSIQGGVGLFTCTPKEDKSKAGEQLRQTTMFNQGGQPQNT